MATRRAARPPRSSDRDDTQLEEWAPAKLAIYDAALELFTTNGYAETSVADVVTKAGLTKGAFYHYFPSKVDLLRACTGRALDFTLPLAREIASLEISATEAITMIFHEVVHNIEVYRREVNLFLDEWNRGNRPELLETHNRREEYERLIEGIFERGIKAGEFRPLASARVLSFALFGLATHTRVWWRPNQPLTADELSQTFAEIFLNGLSAQPRVQRTKQKAVAARA
jgi:TetR/AcrR family transcriptional regulator, cholesterol catabolism regulator